jgi:hypothetical protein
MDRGGRGSACLDTLSPVLNQHIFVWMEREEANHPFLHLCLLPKTAFHGIAQEGSTDSELQKWKGQGFRWVEGEVEDYLIKVQGGIIAEGTDGSELHQPIILPCSDWLIILQAGIKVGRKAGEKRWKTEHDEMQRAGRSRQALGRRDGGLGGRDQGWESRERRRKRERTGDRPPRDVGGCTQH